MQGPTRMVKAARERYVDETGRVRKRMRLLPQDQWAVLIPNHHPGFIDWATFEMNQARMASNYHRRSAAGYRRCAGRFGLAARTGDMRPLWSPPAHLLSRQELHPRLLLCQQPSLNGRGIWCMRIGGVRVERAVVETFLDAISPAGLEAAIAAQDLGETQDQAALKQFRLQVERARYEAERAERRFRSVEPENRLVARTLETEWENKLHDQKAAEAELARKEKEQTTAAHRSATGTNPFLGKRFKASLGRAHHDRPGSERTSAQFAGGS